MTNWAVVGKGKGGSRLLLAFAVHCLHLLAAAQTGTIHLNAFPSALVADGRSTTTISAEIRDGVGRLVPDGTQVVFEASLGELRESLVTTRNGLAQTILRAGGVSGTARVRASALRYSAAQIFEIELLDSKETLDARSDYIEVDGDGSLFYAFQERIIEATGTSDSPARVRYRDTVIEAEDLQINVSSYEVRARRGVLKTKDYEFEFREINFVLNRSRGVASAMVEVPEVRYLPSARFVVPIEQTARVVRTFDLYRSEYGERERRLDQGEVAFRDVVNSITKVRASHIVAFPAREIQFQNADVRIEETSILRLPLYRLSVFATNPIVTEQYVTVSNNSFQVDYPHYLSLSPGRSSALRFRYGERYGTGVGGSGGTFLDYEMRWNEGTYEEGGLTFTGLARDDWGVSLRQSFRPSDRTQIQTQFTSPAHRSLVGNFSLTHSFNGLQVSGTSSYNQNLSGARLTSWFNSVVGELDPWRWDGLPFRSFLGFSANQSRYSGVISQSQETAGLRLRTLSDPIILGPGSVFIVTHQANYLGGKGVTAPFTNTLGLNLSSTLSNSLSVNTAYEYGDDPFTRTALGRHRVTFDGLFRYGSFNALGYLSQSLDIDRYNMSLRASYRLAPLWRLNYSYYFDQFAGSSYKDDSFILSYRLGFREIGLSYSGRTRRIGFELLGTTID
ncbi:MAG: hypothetical protein KF812_01610 [Fimbriimonadaceae bacterium]|nr:hypothetical protein [Fimbriimonadaceae bacterium]